jgi:hypothetical protein
MRRLLSGKVVLILKVLFIFWSLLAELLRFQHRLWQRLEANAFAIADLFLCSHQTAKVGLLP